MSYLEKYGKPQGNELVDGKDIIRRTDICEFVVIDHFMSNQEANNAYKDWLDEHYNEKFLSYSRPLIGIDNNDEPIYYDSWGDQ